MDRACASVRPFVYHPHMPSPTSDLAPTSDLGKHRSSACTASLSEALRYGTCLVTRQDLWVALGVGFGSGWLFCAWLRAYTRHGQTRSDHIRPGTPLVEICMVDGFSWRERVFVEDFERGERLAARGGYICLLRVRYAVW
ncbi:hypothetical protein P153DRAFT_368817 [Dothidotthia symphoricarpi CBS 119687]|uniref:Uncharacterized protein n=1 Tax=Dothidotthia symphoricarpi CBS 119687 TaxID=1392245 RepID=A0A6A6A5E8_9PLEO|nr:uncharacterized protein P153DRAFT_368817 [Dothidotthia symphoricarpi CBS 119687]KAF2126766.1 hypothetical protein P153DRAFT_368817 [Dothidotthia symphoricarpi CBS 119687]